MPSKANFEDLKLVCAAITEAVEPDETFIVEDNFDSLCELRKLGDVPKEGRFISHEALVSFGAAIVVFLLTVFEDAVKEVLKKRVAETLKRFYVKKEKPTADEKKQLKEDILQLLEESDLTTGEKARLRKGFNQLLVAHAAG